MSSLETLEAWRATGPPGARYRILLPGDEGYDEALGAFKVVK
jgi:hypothetical protein